MKTLLIVSDAHSNSTVGLAKPVITLDDGDKISAGIARRFLWQTWVDILKKAQEKKRGELYGILNGDSVELDARDRSLQLITRNQEEAITNAVETFEPFFEMCRGVYVLRGTEAHTGKSGQGEESLAANFDNTIRTDEGRASWWHLPLEIEGVKMDICHHPRGGGGGRPANSQNLVDRTAHDIMVEYANNGEIPPQLVIRSHLHGYRDSRDAFRTRAIITPAMSLLTSYTHRIGINASQAIGAILVYIKKGMYEVEPLLYEVRRATWQTIP